MTLTKKGIFLVYVLLISLTTKSQIIQYEYTIPLIDVVKRAGYGEIIYPEIAKRYNFLRSIPKIECDTSSIQYFKINQYVHKDSIANQVYLFVGINQKKGEKYVVIDTDRNFDFSDNPLFVFTLSKASLPREEKLQRCIGLQIPLDSTNSNFAHIGVDPYGYWSTSSNKLQICITFGDFMTNTTKLGNTPVKIDAYFDLDFSKKILNKRTSFSVRYNDKANHPTYKDFRKGDTIQVQNSLYKLIEIEHPNITLKSIGILEDSSSIGSIVPILYVKDIKYRNRVQLNELMKDKYIFIDFWGSWCNPCISSIPKLKVLYDKIKGRKDVLILGLASENEADLDKLSSIMKEKKIEWNNYWLDRKEQETLISTIRKLDIGAYPTYLIIDKFGKIVYKDSSSLKTQEAIDFFLNIIG